MDSSQAAQAIDILQRINDFWRLYPMVFLAHITWLGFWLALMIVVYFPGSLVPIRLVPAKLLLMGFIGSAIWRSLLAVTSGPNPVVMREALVSPLRILDFATAIVAWVWLVRVLKRVVKIQENLPNGTID